METAFQPQILHPNQADFRPQRHIGGKRPRSSKERPTQVGSG
jgi:hypothetical protein